MFLFYLTFSYMQKIGRRIGTAAKFPAQGTVSLSA
jgi:hypothetical protein